MEQTKNYKLKKPGQDDFYNVEDFNQNADILDQVLKELEEGKSGEYVSKSEWEESRKAILTEGTGEAYTATVPWIKELTPGAEFIMIPHIVSVSKTPTLNVNGLGEKQIKQKGVESTATFYSGPTIGWLSSKIPIRIIYTGSYWVIDSTKTTIDDVGAVKKSGDTMTGKLELSNPNSTLKNKLIIGNNDAGFASIYSYDSDGGYGDLMIYAKRFYFPYKSLVDNIATPTSDNHAANKKYVDDNAVKKSGDTMTGILSAQSNTSYTTAQVRNIQVSTSDLTAGTSTLASGNLYFVYE